MVNDHKSNYIPDKGDIVWLNFSPQKGKEQKGHRPALVITGKRYNQYGLCLACPITSKIKGHLFEVKVSVKNTPGAVLVNHIKAQDWRERDIQFINKVNKETLKLVKQQLMVLMEI